MKRTDKQFGVPKFRLRTSAGFFAMLGCLCLSVSFVYAQPSPSIEKQVQAVARDLPPAARAEFIELIRDPSELGVTFDDLGIAPDLADKIQDKMPQVDHVPSSAPPPSVDVPGAAKKADSAEKSARKMKSIDSMDMDKIEKATKRVEKVSRKLRVIDQKIEKKLSNIKDHQARIIEKALETTTRSIEKVDAEISVVEIKDPEVVTAPKVLEAPLVIQAPQEEVVVNNESNNTEPVVEEEGKELIGGIAK